MYLSFCIFSEFLFLNEHSAFVVMVKKQYASQRTGTSFTGVCLQQCRCFLLCFLVNKRLLNASSITWIMGTADRDLSDPFLTTLNQWELITGLCEHTVGVNINIRLDNYIIEEIQHKPKFNNTIHKQVQCSLP